MGNAAKQWLKLSKCPFNQGALARSPFMIDNEIIISVNNDSFIHKLKTTSEKWSKYAFGKYKDIKWHALCSSNDKKYLYIFEGMNEKIFIQMNIKTMQIVQTMKHTIKTGLTPVIIADPMDDTILHVVGGSRNNKHFTLNIKNGEINALYTFDDVSSLCGGGIVFLQNNNTLLYFHAQIPVHSFNFKTKIWKNTGIKLPYKGTNFGYILTQNEQFVVLFGGYDADTRDKFDDIVLFDIKQQTFKKSKSKTPLCDFFEALLAQNGDIHLFCRNQHYRLKSLNVNNMLNSIDEKGAFVDHESEYKSEEKEENEREEKEENKSEEKEETKKELRMNKVRTWLCDCVGLGEYFDGFIASGYDDMIQIKEGLNEEDFIDIGIHKRGHRKKILFFIEELKDSDRRRHTNEGLPDNTDLVAAPGSPNVYDTAK